MGTRSEDQQKKQRKKEFKERKENEKRLKAAAINAKHTSKNDEGLERKHKTVD
jgi:hypothetical protein